MRLVMLGPPGAGKGTQARRLSKKLNIPHISTGDIFRDAIRKETPLGKQAKEYSDKGQLVPDDITVEIVRERLGKPDCNEGFLLDGFPRTQQQAKRLDQILSEMNTLLDAVVEIQVPGEEIVRRLINRRQCPKCGRIYHLVNNPPADDEICDDCQIKLAHREDDTRKVIENRLKVYHEKTGLLTDYYSDKGILVPINGNQTMDEVEQEIERKLNVSASGQKT